MHCTLSSHLARTVGDKDAFKKISRLKRQPASGCVRVRQRVRMQGLSGRCTTLNLYQTMPSCTSQIVCTGRCTADQRVCSAPLSRAIIVPSGANYAAAAGLPLPEDAENTRVVRRSGGGGVVGGGLAAREKCRCRPEAGCQVSQPRLTPTRRRRLTPRRGTQATALT